MASKRPFRPRIYRLNRTDYRLDLRGKKFSSVLAVVSGGKKSLQFDNGAEAGRKADEIEKMLEQHGTQRLLSVSRFLNEDLDALHRKLAPFNRTLTDAVDHYVSFLIKQREQEASEMVGILVDRWLAEKKSEYDKGTLRQRTLQTLRFFGNKFKTQWSDRRIGTITHHDIRVWLDSLRMPLGDSAVSRVSSTYEHHHLAHLSQFMRWCHRKYQVPKENPCERITVKTDTTDPEYFSVPECKHLLNLCLNKKFIELLPFHTICLFAGVRPKECERLSWKHVDFEDSSLVVLKGQAKTRNARRIEILPTLNTWLKWFQSKHPSKELIPQEFERKLKSFRREFGVWQHNAMRHSFASYYLSGIRKDFGALEANMGNSRVMLQKHYVRFPSKLEANKFWGLTPQNVKAVKETSKHPAVIEEDGPSEAA